MGAVKAFAERVSERIGDAGEITDRALKAAAFALQTKRRKGESKETWLARGVKRWLWEESVRDGVRMGRNEDRFKRKGGGTCRQSHTGSR